VSRALVRLLVNPTLLRFWQKRAATNLSWLRLGRVSEETLSAYAEMLASSAEPSLLGIERGEPLDDKVR
jgi:hypothetical protein